MTSNNEDVKVLEEQKVQETENENITPIEQFSDLTNEELLKFYEENQDAVDIMGGLEVFESLLDLPDEQFEQLQSGLLQMYDEVLQDEQTKYELIGIVNERHYTQEEAEAEFQQTLKSIESINFLTDPKKDFLRQMAILSENKILEIINKGKKVIQIPCELKDGVLPPIYAREGDAGMDIYAHDEITIAPGETKIIPIGIKMAIPEGYAILIQPRSGQSAKTKLRIANTPGLIDSGYRDEIGVIIENIEPPFKDIDYEFDSNGKIIINSIEHGQAYTIAPGQRFAQMRLVQVPEARFVPVDSVASVGTNRGGGFGSSGLF